VRPADCGWQGTLQIYIELYTHYVISIDGLNLNSLKRFDYKLLISNYYLIFLFMHFKASAV